MNQELAQAAKPAAIVASGAAGTWWSHENLSNSVSIAVGVLTAVYIVAQLAHLLRMWYLKERLYASQKDAEATTKIE